MKTMKMQDITSVPSWTVAAPKSEKPQPRGANLNIDKKVAALDSYDVGCEVNLMCKGKLTSKTSDKNGNSYTIEVTHVGMEPSQKDMMKGVM